MKPPEQVIEQLFATLEKGARKPLFGKPRYRLDDALRAAYAAWATGADHDLILAALLHPVAPQLPAAGFSQRVCQLAADEAALTPLREYVIGPGQSVPPLESYLALAMTHLATSLKGP